MDVWRSLKRLPAPTIFASESGFASASSDLEVCTRLHNLSKIHNYVALALHISSHSSSQSRDRSSILYLICCGSVVITAADKKQLCHQSDPLTNISLVSRHQVLTSLPLRNIKASKFQSSSRIIRIEDMNFENVQIYSLVSCFLFLSALRCDWSSRTLCLAKADGTIHNVDADEVSCASCAGPPFPSRLFMT